MDKKTAQTKLAHLCSRREYCVSDLQKKLVKWGLQENNIFEILNSLQKENYINEERYAIAFVKDKFRFNHWGSVKIKYALQQKQIPENFIAIALNEIDEAECESLIKKKIQDKKRTLKADSDYVLQQKVMKSLMAKGFPYEKIKKLYS